MNLEESVRFLPQVGPINAKKLEKLGILTISDLLYHLPFRYNDFSINTKIDSVKSGGTYTLKGTIVELKNQFTKSGKRLQVGKVTDETGTLNLIWFNQLYLPKILQGGTTVSLSGKVDWFGRSLSMISPDYEIIYNQPTLLHTGRLVPVYPETAGVSSKWLRARIMTALTSVQPLTETLPQATIDSYNLLPINEAIHAVHFPTTLEQAEKARRRLAFDELLTLHLSAMDRKQKWQKNQVSHPIDLDTKLFSGFLTSLPFKLTTSQESATRDILSDLSKNIPMNRLLEGDVGSGKTVVAAAAAYATHASGLKTLFMAPTEILALQHAQTLQAHLSPLGLSISLQTSSHKPKDGIWDVLVGTHSLLFQDFTQEIGLVVVDEEHKFGVAQRTKLTASGKSPHFLTMTATPIPRTAALTLYGDLDLSLISELPKGRKPIKTFVVPPEKRNDAFTWVKKQIDQTQTQAFIIYPIIEESQTETLKSVRAAKVEFEKLQKEAFTNLNVALLHGRMSAKEKEKSINSFKDGAVKILIATSVVEVGIDVPNAGIIVIEGADRFGLAQLHQLRGRVGRGERESSCLLLTESSSESSLERLKHMTHLSSGAELAELDLKLRGPGEIYGLSQHGFPEFKAATLTDTELLSLTKQAAKDLFPRLAKLPLLRNTIKSFKISQAESK